MLRLTVRSLLLAFGALAGAGMLPVSPVAAASPFPVLQGTWAGSGRVIFEGGNSEALRCNAYYTSSEGGTTLGLAIRCASASNRLEIRGHLRYSGGRVSGSTIGSRVVTTTRATI